MNQILINGQPATKIEVTDRGFQYGDGLFETVAYKNGELQLWKQHLQRLLNGCQRLGLPLVAESVWRDDIDQLGLTGDAVIKLTLSRGSSGRGYAYAEEDTSTRVTAVYPVPDYPQSFQQGVVVRVCDTPVSINTALAGIKHLNRLDNVLARNEWSDSSIAEGLMLDHHQHVIEGTMSNVFCLLDDELYTPVLERSGVAGVMRGQVIELAEQSGITVNIIEISKQNFFNMDAVFLSNSLIGIWPVIKVIDGEVIKEFTRSAVVDELQQKLENYLMNEA